MAITQSESPQEVMVRAYGDEPVRMIATAFRGRAVEVLDPASRRQARVNAARVYAYHRTTFARLQRAYELRQPTALARLWRRAGRVQ